METEGKGAGRRLSYERHESGGGPERWLSEEKILFRKEVYEIQGAVYDVYREMGCGFLEAVYHECMEHEFRLRGIPFVSQKELRLSYKGQGLSQTFRPDLICFDQILIELKAVRAIAPENHAQTLNYLKATGLRLGLIVNFGAYPKAVIQRLVR